MIENCKKANTTVGITVDDFLLVATQAKEANGLREQRDAAQAEAKPESEPTDAVDTGSNDGDLDDVPGQL